MHKPKLISYLSFESSFLTVFTSSSNSNVNQLMYAATYCQISIFFFFDMQKKSQEKKCEDEIDLHLQHENNLIVHFSFLSLKQKRRQRVMVC